MKTQPFEYHLDQTTFRGHLAYDDAQTGKRPGVLVVHEAWGLGEHARARADRLAGLGYVALAVDLFGDGKQAASIPEGFAWIQALSKDTPLHRARIRAALDALIALPEVDSARTAAIGYCFGGTTALELARSGAPLNGVVSFHGGLATGKPAEPHQVKAKILSMTGADDGFIPLDQVMHFIDEMKHAEADYEVVVYGGTRHGFTNPKAAERGLEMVVYNPVADARSWEAMLAFFGEIFA